MEPPEKKRLLMSSDNEGSLQDQKQLFDNESLLERLPAEVFWKVIEYVPVDVCTIRLTSQTLKSRIDDYARMPGAVMPLVDELRFFNTKSTCIINLSLSVYKCKSILFNLRLSILNLPLTKRFECYRNPHSRGSNVYSLHFPIEEENIVENLGFFVGSRIETVVIDECTVMENLEFICKILERTKFRKMRISLDGNADQKIAEKLLEIIDDNKVNSVMLSVRLLSWKDPVAFLHRLSTIVRSLHICQFSIAEGPYQPEQYYFRYLRANKYLFGVYDADWSEIIATMFSAKLDQLFIDNQDNVEYLPIAQADSLRAQLPVLGKKAWLTVTCHAYSNLDSYIFNGHSISADGSYGPRYLRIKHSSRLDEKSFDQV